MTRVSRIQQTLKQLFDCAHLDVTDESGNHHVPKDAQTHFKIVVVSDDFANIALIQRHRKINQALKDEFHQGMHALSIHAFTPKEWRAKNHTSMKSPNCRDGFKNN